MIENIATVNVIVSQPTNLVFLNVYSQWAALILDLLVPSDLLS